MYKHFFKRLIDFFVSFIGMLFLLLPMLIIAIAIKCDSKGPVFLKQPRTGYKGKIFKLYKFRTMIVETHYADGTWIPHDKRCTRVGRIIRKLSIDELPQLINVLKGEMSLIGPRPWIPEYYENFTDEQRKRCDVLPGITGLAQANGRNAITVFEKIKYDIKYVGNITFLGDIKIIIDTVKSVITKSGAEINQESMFDEIDALKAQIKEG